MVIELSSHTDSRGNDEYNENEIIEKTVKIKKLLIIGCAGCGKSYNTYKIAIKSFSVACFAASLAICGSISMRASKR